MIYCMKCNAPVSTPRMNTGAYESCSSCGTKSRVDVFPAVKTDASSVVQEQVIVDDDAGCYYHPKKKAVVHCASCGRFLCSLCDVEMDDEHICFSCMESGKKKSKLKDIETGRTIYDGFALRLSILPVLAWPFTVVTAPLTLFLVIKYWNAPTSIVGRTKIRFIAAFIIALAQVVLWTGGIFMLITKG